MKHSDRVARFIYMCQRDNPELYKEICAKYPTLTTEKIKRIRNKEVNVGLLGLAPASIAPDVAAANNVESVKEND